MFGVPLYLNNLLVGTIAGCHYYSKRLSRYVHTSRNKLPSRRESTNQYMHLHQTPAETLSNDNFKTESIRSFDSLWGVLE